MEQLTEIQSRGALIQIIDLGHMPYAEALAEQRRRQQRVIESRDTGLPRMDLLIVEHDPPVITISNRPGARDHLLASEAQLEARGVEVHSTDRGGDITWHGPGQIVMYPILDLNRLHLRLHAYLRWLEEIVIRTLEQWQITGHRDCEATGVWVGEEGKPSRKICAMGVRVSRWVTMHGLALNVNPDLTHFDLIVPCGLADRSVTSMANELGDAAPSLDEVKTALRAQFVQSIESVE
ncbi:MAG: lipoyl(octanoyl) transferase [Phycisphaerae bacterium]|nr:lipoyl(octanoyl) transferase [Phycisphaerae bacterium]|tara:strand:- start:9 stop:716 length:708 start_codon:yes stop_codon:yes gene_type:complete